MSKKIVVKKPIEVIAFQTPQVMFIDTLEGKMKANVGDWILTGIHGEQYPVKKEIFEQTYTVVGEMND